MPKYVTLVKWTEQRASNVKDTVTRTEQVQDLAQQMGGQMETVLWTQGAYDLVGIFDFPDDESFAAFSLSVGCRRAVRTESLRGFTKEEMQRVLQKLP